MRRVCAAGIFVASTLGARSLFAQATTDAGAVDPDAGAPSASPQQTSVTPDPTLGPDPFLSHDGGVPAPTRGREAPTLGGPPTGAADVPTPATGPPTVITPVATALPPPRSDDDDDEDVLSFGGRHATVRLRLLVQPQLSWEFFNPAASPNARADGSLPEGIGPNTTFGKADGTTTNRGTFRLRRARLGLELSTSSPFGAALEIDPNLADRQNPASGTIARRFELMARTRASSPSSPRYEVGAGLFKVPFSRDLAEAHGDRVFAERATGTRAMFPEDGDLGVRLRRSIVPLGLTVDLAVINGVAVGEPAFGRSPDLNKTKDVAARVTVKLPSFEAGLGGYAGQSQAVNGETSRVQQRSRAAIALDALFRGRIARGFPETRLIGEVVVGRNMDRGVLHPFVIALPADPNQSLPNFDPRSAWLRLEQDFKNATVGFRYDAYTPDATEHHNTVHTFSLAVARAVGRHFRLMLEVDHVIDEVHAPAAPLRAKIVDVVSAMGQLRY